jgi:hypothetical protein
MAPQRIDLASARRDKSLAWRLCKITTASTEEAAPYKSTGDIYRGQYLDAETSREKDLAGVAVWTAHETRIGEWLLAAQTPFGHWEGVSCYGWAKAEYAEFGAFPDDYGLGETIGAAYAAAVTALYGRALVLPLSSGAEGALYSEVLIDKPADLYQCQLWRYGLRFDCSAYAGRVLRRVRVRRIAFAITAPTISSVPHQVGIYTADTTPATFGTWQTQDGVADVTDGGRGCVQIKCNVELKNYLFVSMLVNPSWTPTVGGDSPFYGQYITLGLEPEI